jgi:glycosyltransferase involved in cell wall biosynthesis
MIPPKVSVIIPAYNNAEYLGETIQSVLDQTYTNFEVIVVNDASPDHTPEVVAQFDDPRVRYIVHEENRGLSAARNTGIRAADGELIALLDGDDLFHPEKLRMHVEFLEKHPDVGVTYNARFELNHSSKTIRELWRPPVTVTLADLVLGFPFSPSDMVLRRDWAFRVDLFDERHTYVGEDLDINCRLALAGCKFASLDRALNYRRYHSGRLIKDLRGCVEDTIRPLNSAFADPRCPKEVLALRGKALASHYHLWSAIAFAQNATETGQEYCSEAVRLNPSLLKGRPCQLVKALISYSIVDDSRDHDQRLCRMFDQLPPDLAWLAEQVDWAVARGYLLRGTRAVMWGRMPEGRAYFERAAAQCAEIDDDYSQYLIAQLLAYETEFGPEAVQDVLRNLMSCLAKIGTRSQMRWLKGCYLIGHAFRDYHAGNYTRVPKEVMHAFACDPKYLTNRGALSILFRSLGAMRSRSNN